MERHKRIERTEAQIASAVERHAKEWECSKKDAEARLINYALNRMATLARNAEKQPPKPAKKAPKPAKVKKEPKVKAPKAKAPKESKDEKRNRVAAEEGAKLAKLQAAAAAKAGAA